tara:strand:- start:236 stop:478 length:243 start_codon:yes stop_codon:yes gene_type:complete
MCFGRPSPPPPPKPEPVDSAIEETASSVTTGSEKEDRQIPSGDGFVNDGTGDLKPSGFRRRRGTRSLQIPLSSGNLNYPT